MTQPQQHRPDRPGGDAVAAPTTAGSRTASTSGGPVGDTRAADGAVADLRGDQQTAPAPATDHEDTTPLAARPDPAGDEPTVLIAAAQPTGRPEPAGAQPDEHSAPAPGTSPATAEAGAGSAERSRGTPDGDPVHAPSGVAPMPERPAAPAVPAVAPSDAGPSVAAAVPPEPGPVGAVPAAAVPPAAVAQVTDAAGKPTQDDPAGTDPAGPASSVPAPDPDGAGLTPAGRAPDLSPGEVQPTADAQRPAAAPWRRLSSAGALIWLLIALFGFTLVVQLRNNDTDQGLSTARQEDLVRILSDLEAREQRLAEEIRTLEASQRQLTSGVQGRRVALAEAEKRANELGLLAGTLPARGPGLLIDITPGGQPIKASAILNTVQELRGAGGEVMQLAGPDSTAVRVVASSSFVDAQDGVLVDGVRLRGPYRLTVIGDPQTMKTALNIPGGVVAAVGNAGGTVIPQERNEVEVTAVRRAGSLQYARPVS
jgi:uncharacterized protein YlxW (UPF0749 family)